jgi:hypothetical protein
MKTLIAIFAAFICHFAQAGVLDLSLPEGGQPVSIVIAEPVERLAVTAIVTKNYSELFVGTRLSGEHVNVSAFIGSETISGFGSKPRLRLVTSASVGDFRLLSIIESKGHTGNYNKTVLGYAVTEVLSMSAVRLNGKNGGRVDFNLGTVNPYVEIVDRKVTAGAVIVF